MAKIPRVDDEDKFRSDPAVRLNLRSYRAKEYPCPTK
jgi:hypothetical protein